MPKIKIGLLGLSNRSASVPSSEPQPPKQNIFDHDSVTIEGTNEVGTPLSLGVVFSSTTQGKVKAVSFWKTEADVATTRSVGIYNMEGDLIVGGTSTSEPAGPGWVSINLDEPLTIEAMEMMVAAVHFPEGAYSAQAGVFDNVVRRGFVLAESNTGGGGNGRYKYGSSLAFPDTTSGGMSFGIDIDFYQDQFPSVKNTGVPAGTVLTPMSGTVFLWDGGETVLEDKNIDGHIIVQAQNVVIRRCRITNTDAGAAAVIRVDTGMTDGVGLLIEDCEINGTSVTVNGIAAEGTFLRNKIIGVDNGINLYGPCVIKDNYIRVSQGTDEAHFDGIENNGASDVIIKHNTILCDAVQTSSVMLNNYYNGLANIDVIDNYLSGGAYTVYVDNTKSEEVVDKDTIRIWYNKMGTGDFGYFSLYTSAVLPLYNYDAVTGSPITV